MRNPFTRREYVIVATVITPETTKVTATFRDFATAKRVLHTFDFTLVKNADVPPTVTTRWEARAGESVVYLDSMILV